MLVREHTIKLSGSVRRYNSKKVSKLFFIYEEEGFTSSATSYNYFLQQKTVEQ
jgi:hypothetical protein